MVPKVPTPVVKAPPKTTPYKAPPTELQGPIPKSAAKAVAKERQWRCTSAPADRATEADILRELNAKFEPVGPGRWITLPHKQGRRPDGGWQTFSVCRILRHTTRQGTWFQILFTSSTMRSKWREFLPYWCQAVKNDSRNPDTRPKFEQYLYMDPDCPTRHEQSIKLLINNTGLKARFKMLWSVEVQAMLAQHGMCTLPWWKIVNEHPPLEIKCIQGGSGDRDIDEDETFPLPTGWKKVYHATYISALPSILSDAGLRAGGLEGFDHRNRLYGSAMNYMRFKMDFFAERLPWTGFREEPYLPRHDCNLMLTLSVPTCAENGGVWKQLETFAMVGSRRWNASVPCIEQAVRHDGTLYYQRPEQVDTEMGTHSSFVSCSRQGCGHRNPVGLVYCFECSDVLPGQREQKITFTKIDLLPPAGRAEAEFGHQTNFPQFFNISASHQCAAKVVAMTRFLVVLLLKSAKSGGK